jgi:hypothetical protein
MKIYDVKQHEDTIMQVKAQCLKAACSKVAAGAAWTYRPHYKNGVRYRQWAELWVSTNQKPDYIIKEV